MTPGAMHVQIVQFRLRPEASRETFRDLTRQMVAWLKSREGFVAYELYEGTEHWSDRIAWETARHAQAGRDAFLNTALAAQLVAMVEEGYTSFMGEAVETS